jgi:chorismate mutase
MHGDRELESGDMVEQRDGNEERELRRDGPASQAREAMLSVAAQLGMSNRPLHDVLVAMTERLQERDHLHQVVADVAEAGGVDRQAPVRDLTNRVREMSGQAPMPAQLAQIVGVDPSSPARDTLSRIRQLVADRADLAQAVADVKDALGVPLEATQGTLLDRIRRVLDRARGMYERDGEVSAEQVVLLLELAQEVRSALELPAEARNAAVLNRIANLQATRAQHEESERELREREQGMLTALASRLGLFDPEWMDVLAAVEKAIAPAVETITMEEAERQRDGRRGAIAAVLELWRGQDLPARDDLVAIAEYLLTGDAEPAVRATAAMMDRSRPASVDGARWTPGDRG